MPKTVPPLPICGECPWKIWCGTLNFRATSPKGEQVKVCPVWWAMMQMLQMRGIAPKPLVPPTVPIDDAEARVIMDAMRRQRRDKLGMPSLD